MMAPAAARRCAPLPLVVVISAVDHTGYVRVRGGNLLLQICVRVCECLWVGQHAREHPATQRVDVHNLNIAICTNTYYTSGAAYAAYMFIWTLWRMGREKTN